MFGYMENSGDLWKIEEIKMCLGEVWEGGFRKRGLLGLIRFYKGL